VQYSGVPAAKACRPAIPADPVWSYDTVVVIDTMITIDSNQAAKDLALAIKRAEEEERARLAARAKLADAYFGLAQAYHLQLEVPDSALFYYDSLLAKFPESPDVAPALFAVASLIDDVYQDSVRSAEQYWRVLDEFPGTDYAGAAIERLGLTGTDADTGYPGAYYREAERIYLEDQLPDSARQLYAWIARQFPTSEYGPKAAYASVIMIEENQELRDSGLYALYQEIVDSFPRTDIAISANQRLGGGGQQASGKREVLEYGAESGDVDSAIAAIEEEQGDTMVIKLPNAPKPKARGAFVYPESELGSEPWEGRVIFIVYIDFQGEISEYELVGASGIQDIDEAARLAVEETFFEPDSIAPDSLNMWYKYEVRVIPPAQERENIFDDPSFR